MKRIAELCDCVVLASNQVLIETIGPSAPRRNGRNSIPLDLIYVDALNDSFTNGNSYEFRPSLGPTWHHCLTTRFVLSKKTDEDASMQNPDVVQDFEVADISRDNTDSSLILHSRLITLTKSPYLPNFAREYSINHGGFHLV